MTLATRLDTPIGALLVETDGACITAIRIGTGTQRSDRHPLLDEAAKQLTAWFAGARETFDLPLAGGTTPRGEAHRSAIASIGYGDTASYGQLARLISSSPRAIGQACRRNPFPIVIPCHRVIGAAGAIGYYSAGDGIATKRWLIEFETGMRARWAA
jgi:methylated-DNA-[protein]-cysteine S-methyltransferase